ncbi:family 1 glycosylhydrolase [Paraflavisolibacter sp. H34]|uniref:family 1 glycosylhydrolase n=1 Tax=Huijunlia imazamoxiresistens TaxID=3127457 RepID=UPI003016D00C
MKYLLSDSFLFATGIENSYPTIRLPDGRYKRVDEMEKTGHYTHWERDFQLVKELGITYLRYGPPYYQTHQGPDRYDWAFTDLTFHRLRELGIIPIVDLCHFGVPDWIGDFQNPDFPELFARYAKAFAARFPYLVYYTPINEIFIAATFSALYGWWNERLQDEKSFVTALKHCCKANVLAMHAILEEQPHAVFIQSESSEFFHPAAPEAQKVANFLNEKRFLSLDLTYGYPLSATMYQYLLENGMSQEEYQWFGTNQVKARCIMGNDYYVTNEHLVHPDGTTEPSGEIFGYYVITHQYYSRYRLPIMHTETNIASPNCVYWLYKEWANVHQLKRDGVPVVGFTWYSLLHQVDWDTALREDAGRVNPLGLFDLDRAIMPVGRAYKKLIHQWSAVLAAESFGLNF